MQQLAFSVKEAAEVSGISRAVLYRALKNGELRARKMGTKIIILRADLEAYLSSLADYQPLAKLGKAEV